MPHLSTLLTAFFMLSTIIAPTLSLDSGIYKIGHTTASSDTVFLDSEYGDNEEVQLNYLREGDNRQLWRVNSETDGTISLENVQHNCKLGQGSTAFGTPTILCGTSGSFTLTPALSRRPNTYYANLAYGDEPRRIISQCYSGDNDSPCGNLTLAIGTDVVGLVDEEFTFTLLNPSS
ncbi:unnamed protein product [Rhizoctonia solani]|uniref:Ricin B lectin domain-containing protein n=1 Tax=Rhizoctonia solani TaxID=456999 RepID=A0A8H3GXZ6_9AGAM|nr:unnamed protein product [Rhizoctonia solani]